MNRDATIKKESASNMNGEVTKQKQTNKKTKPEEAA